MEISVYNAVSLIYFREGHLKRTKSNPHEHIAQARKMEKSDIIAKLTINIFYYFVPYDIE
jgi:hypothetical protein